MYLCVPGGGTNKTAENETSNREKRRAKQKTRARLASADTLGTENEMV